MCCETQNGADFPIDTPDCLTAPDVPLIEAIVRNELLGCGTQISENELVL